jgi:hypothetical protein
MNCQDSLNSLSASQWSRHILLRKEIGRFTNPKVSVYKFYRTWNKSMYWQNRQISHDHDNTDMYSHHHSLRQPQHSVERIRHLCLLRWLVKQRICQKAWLNGSLHDSFFSDIIFSTDLGWGLKFSHNHKIRSKHNESPKGPCSKSK